MQGWRDIGAVGEFGDSMSPRRWLTAHWGMAFICSAIMVVHAGVAQNAAPGAALRTDRVDLPTAINQPPDAIAQLREHARQSRLKGFDAANALRAKQIAEETIKLLILAKDLKDQTDALGTKPLPAKLIREIEVIEMLAHDVQAKMTLTVGAS
jgi:hypothetical protein